MVTKMVNRLLFCIIPPLAFAVGFTAHAEPATTSPVAKASAQEAPASTTAVATPTAAPTTSKTSKPVVALDQMSVAQKALEISNKSKEAWFTAELAELTLTNANAAFDSLLTVESGYENSRMQSLTNSSLDRTQTATTKASLKKSLITGTILGVEYNHNAYKYDYNLNTTTSLPYQQTQDSAGVTLEQALWYDSFGTADRAQVRAAEATVQASRIGRFVDQQNVVLDSVKLFWKAYVAQENFKAALSSRERYEKLVEAVRKKHNLGYDAPGELSQVQAELEIRYQNVKQTGDAFLSVANELITLLKLEPNTDLEFKAPESLPTLPLMSELKDNEIEELRVLRKQKQMLTQAENSLTASESKSWPVFNLVGKYYTSGLETQSPDANNDLWSSAYPKYYYGVKFVYSFGSGASSADVDNKKTQVRLEQSKLDRIRLETFDALQNAKRRVLATHMVAESTLRQRDFREKAALELQKAYNQGRIDINQLVTNLNSFFDAQVAYSKAVGDYQTALQEWSAANDRLVSENKENKL